MRSSIQAFTVLSVFAAPLLAQGSGGAGASTHAFADQPYVIERFDELVRFEADGTGRATKHVRVRIQSPAGLEAFGQLHFDYLSAYQDLSVDSVRVFKPGAPSVLAPASAVQDLSGPVAAEAPVYSDLRQKVVTVPSIRQGDTLDFTITVTTRTPMAPGQFWYASSLLRGAIVLDRRFEADVPAGTAVLLRTRDFADSTVRDSAGRRIYRWHGANLAIDTMIYRHDDGEGPENLAVELSTFHSWSQVGQWYAGLEREREAPDARIRAAADSLVRGRASFADSVTAIYDFVSRNFRYVSLSFGLGRYQPHAASEVFTNQYADCKDKHALLASLLKSVGIASAPALISSDDITDTLVPAPFHFNHVITVVTGRRDTLWLDATPGITPFRYLAPTLRGKPALVIPLDAPARVTAAPAQLPFPETERLTVEAQLADPGHVTATVREALRGDAEALLRTVFLSVPAERLAAGSARFSSNLGFTGTASALASSDPAAADAPFEFHFSLDDPAAVSWSGTHGHLRLPLPHGELDVDSARTDSITIAEAETDERLTLALPAGVTVQPPAPVAVRVDFAEYHSSYATDGHTLTVERVLRPVSKVARSRWREVRAFFHTVDADREQEPLLLRTSPAPGAPAADAAALYQAGVDAYEARNYQAALRSLRRAVAADPNAHEAWNELGRTWLELRRNDSAEVAFRRQVGVVPEHRYAWNNLGLAEWREHKLDSATVAFRRQIAINPLDQWAHANLGRVLHELQRDSAALPELQQAVAITPDDASLLLVLGQAQIGAGQTADALATFERTIALDGSPTSLNNAAYVLAEANVHLDRAEQWVRAAIDSEEVPLIDLTLDGLGADQLRAATSLASYWDTLGWILYRKGDLAAAERYITAAWLLAFHPIMGTHLADVEEHLGRRAEAVRLRAIVRDAFSDTVRVTSPSPFQPPAFMPTGRRLTPAQNAAKLKLLSLRTVRLGPSRTTIETNATLLIGPGPKVEAVRFPGEPTAMNATLERMILAAHLPALLPDSAPIRLPRMANVTCSGTSCMLVFWEGGFTTTVQVSP